MKASRVGRFLEKVLLQTWVCHILYYCVEMFGRKISHKHTHAYTPVKQAGSEY